MKRIVFIGASSFGLRCLDHVRRTVDIDVAGVVTVPRRFTISYAPDGVDLSTYGDFGQYAEDKDIPCHCMKGSMKDPALLGTLSDWRPDCLIVVGWYHMLPSSVLRIAPAYGLHASLLPDYSGGAPLVWAIINGESRTGISLFRMGSGVDDGPIVGSRATDIHHDDTIATLYSRIEDLGTELLSDHVGEIADGTVVTRQQDESARRVFPQRSPEDGLIDWSSPAEDLYNFIRAQTKPYPGAFANCRGEKLTVWESDTTSASFGADAQDGAVLLGPDGAVHVACGGGQFLRLRVVGFRGRDHDARAWHEQIKAEDGADLCLE